MRSCDAILLNRNTRILALDIGEVRTGLALSSVSGTEASALQVLNTKELCLNNKELHTLIEDYEIDTIVIGLPLLADGSEGQQARRTRSLAAKILKGKDQSIQVEFFDESQSSKTAQRRGHDLGFNMKDMRGKLDAHAAAVFLQAYLDTIVD